MVLCGNTILFVDRMLSWRVSFVDILPYHSSSLRGRNWCIFRFGLCLRLSVITFISTSSGVSVFGKWGLRRLNTVIGWFIWIEMFFRRSSSNRIMSIWLSCLTSVRSWILLILLRKAFSSFVWIYSKLIWSEILVWVL